MKKTLLILSALLPLFLLTACFEDEAQQTVAPAAAEVIETPAGGLSDAALMDSDAAISPASVPDALAQEWIAEDIKGGGVIDRLQVTLKLTAEGNVSGHSGCNRYGGQADVAEVQQGKISFGALFSTRMACMDEARNRQEAAFLAALDEVATWRTENGLLYLMDAQGADVLRFSNAAHTSKPQDAAPAE